MEKGHGLEDREESRNADDADLGPATGQIYDPLDGERSVATTGDWPRHGRPPVATIA